MYITHVCECTDTHMKYNLLSPSVLFVCISFQADQCAGPLTSWPILAKLIPLPLLLAADSCLQFFVCGWDPAKFPFHINISIDIPLVQTLFPSRLPQAMHGTYLDLLFPILQW